MYVASKDYMVTTEHEVKKQDLYIITTNGSPRRERCRNVGPGDYFCQERLKLEKSIKNWEVQTLKLFVQELLS